MTNIISWSVEALPYLLPSIFAFVGLLVGARLTNQQARDERRLAFVERQLSEFYSPMLRIRHEITELARVREAVGKAESDWWGELCAVARSYRDPEALEVLLGPKQKSLLKSRIDYDNDQLVSKLIPAYRRMLKLFRSRYWLADAETRAQFPALIRFVEVWDRFLSESHAPEVFAKLQADETILASLYEQLEAKHEALRSQVAAGKWARI